MRELVDLSWSPKWVTHLGCIKGCLDYLSIKVSDAWLFGGTSHAFIINMHEEVCPSGPTAWHTAHIHRLGRNLGYTADCVFSHKAQADFAAKQEMAWETVRKAIDEGLPCYGWELDIPEFYVVYGYDDDGYHFRGPGCDSGTDPKLWKELGNTGIGVVEMYVLKPGRAEHDEKMVRDAFEATLKHATSPSEWIFPGYKAGLAGWDLWIDALRLQRASGFGTAYNAAVWAECRHYAVEFLCEARARLDSGLHPLLDEAIRHYREVSENLNSVSETFPFAGTTDEQKEASIRDADRRRAAIEHLQSAREAEEAGLEVLQRITGKL